MKKTPNYDNVQASGEFEPITEGGHHLIIKQVNETQSKNGDPMIVILFDFAPNDPQAGLILKDFQADDKPDKKWPNRGTNYCLTEYNGETTRNFKTFCTCYEKSNNTQVKWSDSDNDATWGVQFKNKKIGAAFGKVHSVYNGKEQVRTELRWFVSDDKVDPNNIPKEKFLSDADKAKIVPEGGAASSNFMDVADTLEGELPFN